MAGEKKRFVRNRTGGPVFLKGHGVLRAGEDSVEVKSSDEVDAAIEAGVLAPSEAPKAEPQGSTDTTTTDKKGDG